MALTLADLKNLITATQGEDEIISEMARADILFEIMDCHMERHLSKYIKKNTVGSLDGDDIRQIFLIACSFAINEADIRIGNPLLFILQKGKWAVIDELRKTYRRDIRQYCHNCKSETRIHEVNHIITCPKCNATVGVERVQVNMTDDGTLSANVVEDKLDMTDVNASQMVVDGFRERLSGRKADVYDLIMVQGIDRDSSDNYIREVADILGVTKSNVNIRLRQIKEEWNKYIAEKEDAI